MRAADWDRKWELRLDDGADPKAPNRFLLPEVAGLEPGRALDLACGAGRNAVWLAERGWRVTGVDFSSVALAAARRLADARGVEVEWVEADVVSWEPARDAFELALVLYLQLPAGERREVLARASRALRPGGLLVVVGHDRTNLSEGYGGPKDPDVLFTADEVAAELPDLVVERGERVERPVEVDGETAVALDALVVARRPVDGA